MDPMTSPEVERLRTSLALFEDGVRRMRATLRRQHPDASDEQIDAMGGSWHAPRPGAEHGDGVGRPGRLPS
jgi:hypothetical protein